MTTLPLRINNPCWNCAGTAFSSAPAPVALVGHVPPSEVALGRFLAADVFTCDDCGMIYLFRHRQE